MRRHGDPETRGHGDTGTRRRGEKNLVGLDLRVSASLLPTAFILS